jgi:hypothetical protein
MDVNKRFHEIGLTRGVPGSLASKETAADEVNNFQTVAFPEGCLSPEFAWHDVAIELNGHAIVFHAQLLYQGCER